MKLNGRMKKQVSGHNQSPVTQSVYKNVIKKQIHKLYKKSFLLHLEAQSKKLNNWERKSSLNSFILFQTLILQFCYAPCFCKTDYLNV